MSIAPYLSAEEFRRAPFGLKIGSLLMNDEDRPLPDEELEFYIADCMDLVNDYCDNVFWYRDEPEEIRTWNGESLWITPYYGPIRTVRALWLVTGVWSGQDYDFQVGATPAGPAPPGTTFGQVKVNRATNTIDASSLVLSAGAFAPMSTFSAGFKIAISYTSGYDDGESVMPDGVQMAYPTWLKTAMRWVVKDLLEREWVTNRRGMAGVQEVRVADTLFRKATVRNPSLEPGIPVQAKRILDRHYTHWVA